MSAASQKQLPTGDMTAKPAASSQPVADRLERLRATGSGESTAAQYREEPAVVLQRPKEAGKKEYRSVFQTAPAALLVTESDEQPLHGMEPTYQPLSADRI